MSSTVNSLPSLRTLQTLGLTTSSFLSSFAFTASYLAIPSVALAPVSLQVRQWAVIYNYGKLFSPPLATLSALIWSTAAYRASKEGKGWKRYAVAGALTFSILPWTVAVMMPTNRELSAMAAAVERAGEAVLTGAAGRVAYLVERWNWMSAVRAVLPILGVVVGATADV